MKTNALRTPEERDALIAQVKELQVKETLSIKDACKKVGLSVNTFNYWTAKKKGGKARKPIKRRKRAVPELVTSLVAIDAHTGREAPKDDRHFNGNKQPTPQEFGEMIGAGVGSAIRAFFQGRVQ